MTRIKVCGVTSPADAEGCVARGASLIGLNFIPASPRYVNTAIAKAIAEAIRGSAEIVGVFANAPPAQMDEKATEVGLDWVQLHGDEPDTTIEALRTRAYKAYRIASTDDVELARAAPGGMVLADARVDGLLGGTGRTFDWRLVVELAASRPVILAGGLTPDNVGEAVRTVRPFAVDVASGVESAPGKKDLSRVGAFVRAVERALS